MPKSVSSAASNAARQGVFFANAAVIHAQDSWDDVMKARAKFTVDVPATVPGRFGWRPRDDVSVDALNEIVPLLTNTHERFHYQQVVSTPFGLLEWRVLTCIRDDVAFLVSVLERSKSTHDQVALPILEWMSDGGLGLVLADMRAIAAAAQGRNLAEQKYHRRLQSSVVQTLKGAYTLLVFLNALLGREEMTMGAFVRVANKAMQYSARRCDIECPVWSAHDLSRDSYRPASDLGSLEVLEAGARMTEFGLLEGLRTKRSVLEEWYSGSIHGVYAPGFNYLITNIGSSSLGVFLTEQALLGPADPALRTVTNGPAVVCVEDVLPAWRLERLVEGMRRMVWPQQREARQALARRTLAESVGLTAPEDTLRSMTEAVVNGPNGWFSNLRAAGDTQAEIDRHYRTFLISRFVAGATLRLEDPLALSEPSVPAVFQPILEIHGDRAFVHRAPDAENAGETALRCYLELVAATFFTSLLSDGDLSELRSIETAMRALIRDIPFAVVVDVRTLVQSWAPHLGGIVRY